MFISAELDQPTDCAMKALILHDDFTLAAKVEGTLQRAITRADAGVRWTVNSVPIDALVRPAAAERILVEALDVHLIVFAGTYIQLLPQWVFRWLDQWADMRSVPDAGLAVMDNKPQSIFGDVAPELSRFASKHQLTFINDEIAAPAKRAKLSIRDRLEEGFPVVVAQKPVADSPIPPRLSSPRHQRMNFPRSTPLRGHHCRKCLLLQGEKAQNARKRSTQRKSLPRKS